MINPDTRTDPTSTVVGGVVVVTAGVFLVNAAAGHGCAFAAAHRTRPRRALPTRLGLANPIAHRVRMLLTVGPFALVVFTLAYAEGLSSLINHELARTAPTIGGDYTLFAESSTVNPYDFSRVDRDAVSHVARTGTVFASFVYDPGPAAAVLARHVVRRATRRRQTIAADLAATSPSPVTPTCTAPWPRTRT